MKLDDFLKKDSLDFLDALDISVSKDSKAATDDTAFLLSSKEKIDGVDLNSNEFDGISLDIDLFPEESSEDVYIEPSALTSPSEDAPKAIQEKVYSNSPSSSSSQQTIHPASQVPTQVIVQKVPVQQNSVPVNSVSSLTKTQIKTLVEEELKSKMAQLHSQVPSTKEVIESDHKEAIIRLKNELVDLKTIVTQLQTEKDKVDEVLINQEKMSEELKESKLHESLIEEKLTAQKNSVPVSDVPPSVSHSISSISSTVSSETPMKLSSADVFHMKKTLDNNFSESSSNDSSSLPDNFSTPITPVTESKKQSIESITVSKKPSSNEPTINIPKLVLPKRSKELPYVLFIEEELHKLRSALSSDDVDLAKRLYSSIKRSASKLTQHDDEKKVIYDQLKQASLILSFKLNGRVQSKKPFGKQLVPTNISPTVLVSKGISTEESFDSSSMEKYLEALTALKRKEKAKSLELLIQLNDSYPSHLGIKLRLQQALAL